MKKGFSIFMSLFLVTSASFAFVLVKQNTDCNNYAVTEVVAEQVVYDVSYTDEEAHEAYTWAYNNCMSAGGSANMLDTVYL